MLCRRRFTFFFCCCFCASTTEEKKQSKKKVRNKSNVLNYVRRHELNVNARKIIVNHDFSA